MNVTRSFAVLLLFTAGSLPAQDQATTLLAACRAADVIVCATVSQATDPSPDWHRLQFTTDQQLKGAPLPTFTLLEPSGPCCGRSLFALQIGDRRLLFLRRVGSALHPFGGARGVLPAAPSVLAHVQALLSAPNAANLAHLLAHCLDAAEPRIADDAAHALAAMPQLALPAGDRDRVAAALQAAVARGATSAAALVDVAVRHQDAAMLDVLLPAYLTTRGSGQAALLRAGLARCTPSAITERLPLHLGTDDDAMIRAAELLAILPAAAAAAPLQQLLQATNSPRVQLAVAAGLLATGTQPATLTGSMPEPVLDLATRRQLGRQRFRAIDPYRR